jgi:hypothetical protein
MRGGRNPFFVDKTILQGNPLQRVSFAKAKHGFASTV